MKKGDIYYVDLGNGVGSEQSGIRPCLIVQNDTGNKYSNTTIICSITSKNKKALPTHIKLDCLKKDSIVLCEHIRTVDKKRIIDYVTSIPADSVDDILMVSLGIKK